MFFKESAKESPPQEQPGPRPETEAAETAPEMISHHYLKDCDFEKPCLNINTSLNKIN